jgi:hypothetical protein
VGLFLAAAVAATACTSSPGPRPALELDVAQYIARIKRWAAAEREVSAAIAEIFRSHFVDPALVTSVTGRTLPIIEEQLAAVTGYTPKTPEVGKIHSRYTRAWLRLREGFNLIDEGMKADDAMNLAQGRRRLEAWQEDMLAVAAALGELAEEVGISKTKTAAVQPLHRRQQI